MGTAIKPNKAFDPDEGGTSHFAARADDPRITALDGVTPTAAPAALGATTNLTAIAGVYADLAAARTSVDTLRTDAEARLDAIEAKIDALRTALIASGVLT